MIPDFSVRLLGHRELKYDVAVGDQTYKSFNAGPVTVNQFLVGKLVFGFGGAHPRFHESGARMFFGQTLPELRERPISERICAFAEINLFVGVQDVEQQSEIVWRRGDWGVAGEKPVVTGLASNASSWL